MEENEYLKWLKKKLESDSSFGSLIELVKLNDEVSVVVYDSSGQVKQISKGTGDEGRN